jgi:hypothetical protein
MAYCALHKREFSNTEPCPFCKAARERRREERLDEAWEDLGLELRRMAKQKAILLATE